MGVYETHKISYNEINTEQLLTKLDEKMNKIFNSKLNIKNIIKAINGCVLPTCTYLFSHEFSDEERMSIAKNVDLRIRSYMNVKNMKLSCISNARCYLPREKLGLGLRSAEVEMDKAMIKNLIHMVLSPHLKFAIIHDAHYGAKWRDRALTAARKYGIEPNIRIESNRVKVNNIEYGITNIKEAKHKVNEMINEFSEKKCPWLNKENVTPEFFKKASMYQDNACNKLNSPDNEESTCLYCNKRDNSNHVMGKCDDKTMVKKRKYRHDRVFATIINSITYEKTNKFIKMSDLRKVHEIKDLKVAVNLSNYIENEEIYHSRPDIIIEKEKEIIVADVSIVTPLHLESANKLKTQRYTINGQHELIVPVDDLEIGPNYCNYLSKRVDKKHYILATYNGHYG
uniref:Uncharacterized protein n=1 Tax=Strongyloides stercoralis TaxID=6248 RepID=A0AAF5DHD2_STRER